MSQAFVEHCLELLTPLGATQARRMFGGHGLYADGIFVGLIAFDRLYLKVDADTEARFAAAGCAPFVYEGKGAPIRMSYWTVPDEAMESPALMAPWARLAMQAAVKAAAAKAAKAPKRADSAKAPAKPAATGQGARRAPASKPARPAAPGAKPRAPRARPRAPRRCPPAGPGARQRRASGRPRGRRRASA
ncbi:MAG: TfoX/Sxy family protein [Burkholderiales bacterium]|nr:TfoX/Sxy family protein [Burkholderiales bacterium]